MNALFLSTPTTIRLPSSYVRSTRAPTVPFPKLNLKLSTLALVKLKPSSYVSRSPTVSMIKDSKKVLAKVVKVESFSLCSNNQTLLFVGDGDLSYAESVARAFGDFNHYITTTTLDTTDSLKIKYLEVEKRIKVLEEELGVKYVLNIDATKLKTKMAPHLLNYGKEGKRWDSRELFDVVVFMFPFARKAFGGPETWKVE